MFGRLRRQIRTDEGVSLVEMLVALVVTSIAFTALAAAILSGVRSAQASASTTGAQQLASEEVERLRTIDWDFLGHYSDEAGWGTGLFGGESLVELDDVTPSPRPVEVPYLAAQTHTVDGVDYEVTTRVTWNGSSVSSPNDGTTYAAKRITVLVEWSVKGVAKETQQTALRTPNSKEMRPPSSGSATSISVYDTSVGPDQVLTVSGNTTGELTLLATSSIAATEVSATYTLATGNTATVDLTPDATNRYWTGSLPAGSGTFASGTTSFTFTAVHSSGSSGSDTAEVQFTDPVTPFSLTGPSATTATSQLAADYTLAAAVNLAVSTSSTATGVVATYPLSSGGTGTVTLSASGNNWTGSIPLGAGPVSAGNLTITLTGTSSSGGTAIATTSVVLQAPSLGAIEIVGMTASPALCSDNNSPFGLHFATTMTAEVKNVSATTGTVTIKLGTASAVTATPTGTVGSSGGQLFRITVAANTAMPTTPVTVQVVATRSADGASSTRDFSMTVKHKNSSNAC